MNLNICEIILYPEHFDSTEVITGICDNHKTIKQYCLILHDKDTDTCGNPKKSHYHLYLNFGRGVDTVNCEKWFKCSSNAINRIKGRWKDALLYATHRNSPEKFQYSDDSVISNFDYSGEIERLVKEEASKLSASQLNDMCTAVMNGNITLATALKQLQTFSYCPTAQKRLDDAYKLRCRNMSFERNIDVYLIYGMSETGKTTLAKMLCDAEKIDYYISSSDNDSLQDYKGERALILDDARQDTFSLIDWLRLLDNNTNVSVKSRFFNKLFTGDLIIITTSVNPLYWFQGGFEDRWQFFRRITNFIVVTNDTVAQYDGFIKDGHTIKPNSLLLQYGNPVKRLYQKTDRTNGSQRFARMMGQAVQAVNNSFECVLEVHHDSDLLCISE